MAENRFVVKIPNVLVDSIDDFIKHGNGVDIVPPDDFDDKYQDINYLDIRPISLMKLLVSMYGEAYTPEADDLINNLITTETKMNNLKSLTIRTTNPRIRDIKSTFVIRLIRSMVWFGIPIEGYFDGQRLIK